MPTLQDTALDILWFANKYGVTSEWTSGRIRVLIQRCDGWVEDDTSLHERELLNSIQELGRAALQTRSFPAYFALTQRLKSVLPIPDDAIVVSEQKHERGVQVEGSVSAAA